MLTFQAVAQRLQRTVRVSLHRARLAGVVEQRVDGLLQHALLITHNHIRSIDFHQTLQTVVADDDATVKVVQVGSGKTTAIQRDERAQLRRSHGHHLHYHPLGTVFDMVVRLAERLKHLQTLQQVLLALLSLHFVSFGTQAVGFLVKVDAFQQVINGLGTHLGDELIRVVLRQILVLNGQHLHQVKIFFLAQEFESGHFAAIIVARNLLAFEKTALNHHITLVVNDGIEFLGRDAQQSTYFIRQRTEIPNVGDGHHQ